MALRSPTSEGADPGLASPSFSIVIPARDEADSIIGLLDEICDVLPKDAPCELLVVDDGSRDGTLEQLVAYRPHCALPLRILRHAERAGQSAALRSGFRAARGRWIVTLDGDGQNDPADIPRLFAALDSAAPGVRMVCGHRRMRRDRWSRRAASRIANGVRGWLLGDHNPDTGCGLKLIERDTARALPFFDHIHRFLPALVARMGGGVISVEVNHRPRRAGRSKYGNLDRLLEGIVDLAGVSWLLRRTRPYGGEEIDTWEWADDGCRQPLAGSRAGRTGAVRIALPRPMGRE